jgi:hypothetical protein
MNRLRTRYETAFALTAVLLAIGALFAFSQLGPITHSRDRAAPVRASAATISRGSDERALVGARAIAATDADYRRFAAEDAAWRRRHAQLPDLFVLKRRAMEERVYVLNKSGQRGIAIGELERWTTLYPHDREAVLWLARLLREAGRTKESLARYRQVLSSTERAP